MNVSKLCAPKSDQLNADDLISGERIIKIVGVFEISGDQKVAIRFDGDNNRPWKPCKTMLKMLSSLWGEETDNWVGQSVTIYNDQTVKWAGTEVGGIRVSHATGIAIEKAVALNTTRGKKGVFKIKPLVVQNQPPLLGQPKQVLDVGTEAFEKTIAGIISGEYSLELVESRRDLTPAAKSAILDAIAQKEGN